MRSQQCHTPDCTTLGTVCIGLLMGRVQHMYNPVRSIQPGPRNWVPPLHIARSCPPLLLTQHLHRCPEYCEGLVSVMGGGTAVSGRLAPSFPPLWVHCQTRVTALYRVHRGNQGTIVSTNSGDNMQRSAAGTCESSSLHMAKVRVQGAGDSDSFVTRPLPRSPQS